ncbi:MAG: uracil-DNA glycosylase family protein [Pirellulales bacterium]|nr:uracil-DNA glycosylase family protein [Pirellulales bacterium]
MDAKILIIGQAPGRRVHASGVPWDDPSGDRLRSWLGVERSKFYDADVVALIPMGFCYPGAGTSGDLPPRPECAATWHASLLAKLANTQLTLLIGRYAQAHYLTDSTGQTLTETVQNWRQYAPDTFPLPHPSPRNNRWLKKNAWFEAELLPALQQQVLQVL